MPDARHLPQPPVSGDDLDLTLLRTFLAAHRAGSMTRAAAELGLSQPGVTAQIRRLERRLGVTLFHRGGRGLTPTAAGDELALRIGPHLDALTAALTELAATAGAPFTRTVLLGGPPELTAVRVLPSLAELYPRGLRVRVTTGPADDLLAELAGGGLDLVVSTIRPRGRALTGVPIADEEFVLVAAPQLAAGLDRDRLAADPVEVLGNLPVVAYSEELPIVRRYWRHVFGRPVPRVPPAVVVPDLRAVAAACAAGAGYSALPRYLIGDLLDTGRLVLLHEPEDPPINTFYLAWRSSAVPHPAVDAVRAHLAASAARW